MTCGDLTRQYGGLTLILQRPYTVLRGLTQNYEGLILGYFYYMSQYDTLKTVSNYRSKSEAGL